MAGRVVVKGGGPRSGPALLLLFVVGVFFLRPPVELVFWAFDEQEDPERLQRMLSVLSLLPTLVVVWALHWALPLSLPEPGLRARAILPGLGWGVILAAADLTANWWSFAWLRSGLYFGGWDQLFCRIQRVIESTPTRVAEAVLLDALMAVTEESLTVVLLAACGAERRWRALGLALVVLAAFFRHLHPEIGGPLDVVRSGRLAISFGVCALWYLRVGNVWMLIFGHFLYDLVFTLHDLVPPDSDAPGTTLL